MKKFLFTQIIFVLLFTNFSAFSQNGCPNADFSFQDFTNWQGFTGTYGACCPTPGIVAGRHTIMNVPGTDANTGNLLSVLPPGLSVGARLGNQNVGAEAEKLRYELVVDASNALFFYRYAVVLEDPSHSQSEQPKFDINVIASSSVGLCGEYHVVSGGSIPGFQSYGSTRWKDWTTVGIDLTAYMGQTVAIEYTTYDCSQSGHFGYAYLSCDCSPLSINVGYCQGNLNAVLLAPPGFTYLWNPGGATTQSITINNPTIGTTYTCVLTAPNGCSVTLSTVLDQTEINADFNPVIDNCTYNVNFYDSSTVNQGTIGTWLWDFGDGSSTAEQSPFHTFPGPGTYTISLDVTSTAGNCPADTSIQITINPIPNANAGTDNSVCSQTYQLQATPSLGTGTWTYTGPGTATISDDNVPNPNVTVDIDGVYSFIWSEDNGSGCVSADTVLITFNETPIASAGPDQTLCLLNTIMAAIPSVGIGTWTVAGPGTIIFGNVNLPTTAVTASVEGQYIFTWTEVNSACTSSDNVTVTFTQMPVANAGTDINVCQLNTTLAAVATVGTGTWTQTSGNGTINFTDINDALSGISTTTTQDVYVLTWTEDNGNDCVSSDQVQVTLSQTPVANAGTDAALCLLTYNLNAIPSVGTGTWTSVPATATFSPNEHVPNANATVPGNDVYTFTWTEDNTNGCIDSDDVVITFTQMPTANAGTDINICQLDTNLAAVPSVGTGTWTVSGPGILNIDLPNSSNTTVSTLTQGVYNLTWTEDNGNGCIDSDNMVLTLTNQPVSNAGVRDSVCSLTFTLIATPSYGTGTWSQLSGPGSSSFDNQNFSGSSVTTTVYGDYNFIWAEDNGNGCTDADTVLITFNYIPTSSFTVDQINCFGDDATVTYIGNAELLNAQFSWTFSNANIISGSNNGPYEIDYSNAGTNNISLTVTEHGCVSPITSIPVLNPPLLTLSLSKIDVSCNGFGDGQVFTSVAGGTPNYNYSWSNGLVFSTIVNASPNIYKVTVTDINGCTVKDSIIITEPPKLVIDMLHNVSICDGNDTTLTASATGGMYPYTLLWNTGSPNSSITVAPHVTTNYYIVVTDANQCTSISNVEVYVYPPLLLSVSQNKDSICPGESFVISAVANDGKEPYIYYIDGVQTTVPITIFPNTQHTYQITVKDGCDYQAQSEIYVYVYPSPTNFPTYDIQAGCIPFTVSFNEGSPDIGQSYLWDFGDGSSAYSKNPVHTFNQAGDFDVTVTVTSVFGCKTTNFYQDWLTAYPLPVAQFEPEPPVATIIKPIIVFNNYSQLADSVRWFFGDGDSSNIYTPSHRYPAYPTGTYNVTLIVYTAQGCSDTITDIIEIQDVLTFYAPTAFSPDKDGKNETFLVFGNGINLNTFELFVFDRWGEVIFKSTNMEQGWDGKVKGGKIAPVGVYTWLVKFRDFKGVMHEKSGSVTVVR